MILIKNNIFPFFCLFLFLGHQFLQKCLDVNIVLVDNYLDNLLCMPILLTLVFWERRILSRNPNRKLTLLEIFSATLLVSLVSELVFPYYSNDFTFDWWDFIAFGLGAAAYIKHIGT